MGDSIRSISRADASKRGGMLLTAMALAVPILTGCDPLPAAEAKAAPSAALLPAQPTAGVSAIGRLEPEDGVIRLAGPSQAVVVIGELKVAKGDRVREGEIIAVLDDVARRRAEVARARAAHRHAATEFQRDLQLHAAEVLSDARRDRGLRELELAKAEMDQAEAELELALVRSPIDGQVIDIHAREGERVGAEGILELAKTEAMFAVAEIFETDIDRLHVGQLAAIDSPLFPGSLMGRVERIGLKVGKADALGTDPAAKTDARVIEVEIRLDDSTPADGLTYHQVTIEFQT